MLRNREVIRGMRGRRDIERYGTETWMDVEDRSPGCQERSPVPIVGHDSQMVEE
jgi:hypothetical protein